LQDLSRAVFSTNPKKIEERTPGGEKNCKCRHIFHGAFAPPGNACQVAS
jgi:hypothetical protein